MTEREGVDPVPAAMAAILLVLLAAFQLLMGIATISGDGLDVASGFAFRFTSDAWGWTFVALSVPPLAAGMGLLLGASWARPLSLLSCVTSSIVCFAFVPIQTAWSILVIVLDLMVLGLLVLRWRRRTPPG
jgi:hypothetical protein